MKEKSIEQNYKAEAEKHFMFEKRKKIEKRYYSHSITRENRRE